MYIGDFGILGIDHKDASVDFRMSMDEYKSRIDLKAFAMTFKTTPEHSISDGYNSDAEL